MGVRLEVALDVPKMVQVEQWISSQQRNPLDAYFRVQKRIPSRSPERNTKSATKEFSPPMKKCKSDSDVLIIPESRYEQYQKRLRDTLKQQVLTMRSLVFNSSSKPSFVEKEEESERPQIADATQTTESNNIIAPLHPDLDDMESSEGVDISSFMNGPIVPVIEPECHTEAKTSKCGRKTRVPARYSEPNKPDQDEAAPEKPTKQENKPEKRRPSRDIRNVSQPTLSGDQVGEVPKDLKIKVGAQFTSFAQFEAVFSAWKQQGNHTMRIVSSESLKDIDKALAEELKYKKVVYHCYYYGSHRNKACGCEAKLRLCYNKQNEVLRIVGLVSDHKGHDETEGTNEPLRPKVQKDKKRETENNVENNETIQENNNEDTKFPEDKRIFLGATFKSYEEFDSIFGSWRTNGCHSLRIISSEALRDSDGVQDAVLRYKKLTYHCYHYGSLHNRVPGSNGKITTLACGCESMLRLSYIKNEEVLKITGLVAEHKGHVRDRGQFNSIMNKMLTLNRGKKRDAPAVQLMNNDTDPIDLYSNNELVSKQILNPPDSSVDRVSKFTESERKKDGYRFTSKSIMPIADDNAPQPSAERSNVATAVLIQTLLSQKMLMSQLSADPSVASDPQKYLLLEMTKLQHLQLLVQLQHLNTPAAP